MDNCFTGRRYRSLHMPEKAVIYIIPTEPVRECIFARWCTDVFFLSFEKERVYKASYKLLTLFYYMTHTLNVLGAVKRGWAQIHCVEKICETCEQKKQLATLTYRTQKEHQKKASSPPPPPPLCGSS